MMETKYRTPAETAQCGCGVVAPMERIDDRYVQCHWCKRVQVLVRRSNEEERK